MYDLYAMDEYGLPSRVLAEGSMALECQSSQLYETSSATHGMLQGWLRRSSGAINWNVFAGKCPRLNKVNAMGAHMSIQSQLSVHAFSRCDTSPVERTRPSLLHSWLYRVQ